MQHRCVAAKTLARIIRSNWQAGLTRESKQQTAERIVQLYQEQLHRKRAGEPVQPFSTGNVRCAELGLEVWHPTIPSAAALKRGTHRQQLVGLYWLRDTQ